MKAKVILYYANWCGLCTTFKPIWDDLKESQMQKQDIEFHDVEASVIDDETAKNLVGYPTIIVLCNNTQSEYKGPRTKDSLLEYVTKIIEEQKRKNTEKYQNKYYKYKSKYINIKKKN